ncbi:MAG: hypothetical protein AAB330_02740, partial [Bacteroidota bacterium]
EKLMLIMENFWKSASFNDLMKATIGKTYKEFDEEWLYHLKKRYYPAVTKEDLPSSVTKSLVDVGFNGKPVFFAHDGKRELYFIGNHTGYTSVYRLDLDKEKSQPEIVIEGERTDEFEAFHLFQSKLDVSKDGTLAFITKSGENDALHLYDVKKLEKVETIRFKNLVVLGSPSWSPDGKRIVFSSIDKGGNNDLYLYDIQDRSLLKLTDDFYDDRDPSWCPTGDVIAFSSDRTPFGAQGKYNLFTYDLSTGGISFVTHSDDNYYAPSWSRDGRWLAFTSDAGGSQNIWMMDVSVADPQARAMKRITNFVTGAYDPSWGDSDELVCTAFENFSFQIRKVPNVSMKYDSSATVKSFDFSNVGPVWQGR